MIEECDMNVSFPQIEIADRNGELFSIWGPCSGNGKDPCDCPQCKHADNLAAQGLDWDDEYKKAKDSIEEV